MNKNVSNIIDYINELNDTVLKEIGQLCAICLKTDI
jgi:hypothetical protein